MGREFRERFVPLSNRLCWALLVIGICLGSRSEGMAAEASPSGAVVSCVGDGVEIDRLIPGVKLFRDREFALREAPPGLQEASFVRGSIEGSHFRVLEPGLVTLIIPTQSHPRTKFQGEQLTQAGFERLPAAESWWLFGPEDEVVACYRKQMQRGEQLSLGKFAILVGIKEVIPFLPPDWSTNSGERLESGIVLPEIWPPLHLDAESADPMPVPYLQHPPAVIGIDRGRQLFVDNFLIESTDLEQVFHQAKKYPGNPVFRPETRWELTGNGHGTSDIAAACYLGHGGVFYDPAERQFKMFYTAGWRGGLAMATSTDLVHWERPDLHLAGGNLLLPPGLSWQPGELKTAASDNCVWLDLNAKTPQERIKYLACWDHGPRKGRLNAFTHSLYTSDGTHWTDGAPTGRASDYCSFFYNPFRQVWVFSIKQDRARGRCRFYSENVDFLAGADWSNSVYWTNADRLDPPEPTGNYPGAGEAPQLYSLNAVAYESLLVGMHYILRGPQNEICGAGKFPKLTDLELGFSRDGFHWHRPDRRPLIAGERHEGTWDRAYLHGTAGLFLVLGDQLVFPYTGYSGISPSGERGMYTGASVGLATLRRDGFASLEAHDRTGSITTRPLRFSGSHLFVNAAAEKGSVRAAVIDDQGQQVAPFTLENCRPLHRDSTLSELTWAGAANLSMLAGKPVRLHFEVTNASLYSFWVSEDASGSSQGYLAAGSPGVDGLIDTLGQAATSRPSFLPHLDQEHSPAAD